MKVYHETTSLDRFIHDQLSVWETACANYRSLKSVLTRELTVGGVPVILQFNPNRIVSSSADIRPESLAERACFLCRENRGQEQSFIPYHGKKGKEYDILVNPFPIFPRHLTVALSEHLPQSIYRRYADLLAMAQKYPGNTFFYNGPKCGASAPDHHHFQAGNSGLMPVENAIVKALEDLARGEKTPLEYVTCHRQARLYNFRLFTSGIFVIDSPSAKDSAKLFYRLLDCCPMEDDEQEPKINLISLFAEGHYVSVVFVRRAHRSHHYYAKGEDNIFMSLGSVDMGGIFIASKRKDFDKVTCSDLEEILSEISVTAQMQEQIKWRMMRTQQALEVGIMSGQEISFRLLYDGAGIKSVRVREGRLEYDGMLYDELYFDAPSPSSMFSEASFELEDVTIGKGFHWERAQRQRFAGALKFIIEDSLAVAVNVIGIEDYLLSVISSEMNASSPVEFLKAHAVISRSWLVAQMRRRACGELRKEGVKGCWSQDEIVRWYDGSDHRLFDVCADDHCQRYQGIGMVTSRTVMKVIDSTWGEVLMSGEDICDARFSKCCGGRTEVFSTCWQDTDYPYLQGKDDPFCNTDDQALLSCVLNSYDRETAGFYRWRVSYSRDELSQLVSERTGVDFGTVTDLVPLERGTSGRIFRLKIVGTAKTLTVGKELEIRRILSRSHLYSSAFEVVRTPDGFVLEGKGWGHGVGLCQIGAAVMGSKGYSYRDILSFYYPGSRIGNVSLPSCGEQQNNSCQI